MAKQACPHPPYWRLLGWLFEWLIDQAVCMKFGWLVVCCFALRCVWPCPSPCCVATVEFDTAVSDVKLRKCKRLFRTLHCHLVQTRSRISKTVLRTKPTDVHSPQRSLSWLEIGKPVNFVNLFVSFLPVKSGVRSPNSLYCSSGLAIASFIRTIRT